jgi:hypothetical protein
MSTLYLENFINEDLWDVGLDAGDMTRAVLRGRSGEFLWMAGPGDVLVLAREPSEAFLTHVTRILEFDPGACTVLVPPPGRHGDDVLTRDRLTDPGFVSQLTGFGCTEFVAYYLDRFTTSFAESVGAANSIPGRAFVDQGGADLFNSKSVFRSLATGLGMPVADGTVVRGLADAVAVVDAYLGRGAHVILKRDFHGGGLGNFVLSAQPDVPAIGAVASVHTPGGARTYLEANWHQLTSGGGFPLTVEEYHLDCTTLCAEFTIAADDIVTDVLVEMRMRPRVDGFVWLDPATGTGRAGEFRVLAYHLADVMRRLGYRGVVNIDGVVTPAGRTLMTEFNARLSGFTHLHRLLTRLVSPDYAWERHVAAGIFPASSTKQAESVLARAGLSFDHRRRVGVVLTSDSAAESGRSAYCAVATSAADLADLEQRLSGAA